MQGLNESSRRSAAGVAAALLRFAASLSWESPLREWLREWGVREVAAVTETLLCVDDPATRVKAWAGLEALLSLALSPSPDGLAPPSEASLLPPRAAALADEDSAAVRRARADHALGRLVALRMRDEDWEVGGGDADESWVARTIVAALRVVAAAPVQPPHTVAAATSALDVIVDRAPHRLDGAALQAALSKAWDEAAVRAGRFVPLATALRDMRAAASAAEAPPTTRTDSRLRIEALDAADEALVRSLFVLEEWLRGVVWSIRSAHTLHRRLRQVEAWVDADESISDIEQ